MTPQKPKRPQRAAKSATDAADAKPKALVSRSLYTEALAEEICSRLAIGEPLKQICRSEHMPSAKVVLDWVLEDRDGFSARYARARDLCIEAWSDEVITLADAPAKDAAEVNRARLRVDSRKWLLSKLKPERYGDSVRHVGTINAIQANLTIPAEELREIARKVAEEF